MDEEQERQQSAQDFELNELHHQVMRLLCEGKNAGEIYRDLRVTYPNLGITEGQIKHLLHYDKQRDSIYYRLSMLVYHGEREIRDQAHAVHQYTLRYIVPNLIAAREQEREADMISSARAFEPDQLSLWQPWGTVVFTTSLTTLYICSVLFLFTPAWIEGCTDCFVSYYTNIYFLIPLTAGVYGLIRLRKSRLLRGGIYGPAFILFCTGFIAWGVGNAVWLAYTLVGWEVPYPSIADAAFVVHSFTWVFGMGVIYNSISPWPRPFLVTLVIVVAFGAIGLVLVMLQARGWMKLPEDPFKFILDILYPLMEIINVTLLASLIRKVSDDESGLDLQKAVRWLSVGMIFNFVADFTFSYSTSLPETDPWTYVNGRWPDFFFATAFFILGIGVQFIPLIENGDQRAQKEQRLEEIV